MAQDHRLDLRRHDRHAAAADDVLAAPDVDEVAVLVEHAEVAGAVAAPVGQRLARQVVVVEEAEEAARAVDDHRADLAGRQRLTVVADDADLRAVVRAALGAHDLLVRVVGRVGGVAGHLGQPVVAERRRAERLVHRQAALRRQAGAGEHAHGGQVAVGLLGGADHVGGVRRHREDVGAAVLLDQPQRLLGLPAAEQDAGRAVEQDREVAEDEAADEAELDDGQVDVLAGQPPARADALGRVAQRVARVRDALRRRRRARGVQDQREVVGVARGALVGQVLAGERVDVLGQDRERAGAGRRRPRGTWRSPSRRRSSRSPPRASARRARRAASR